MHTLQINLKYIFIEILDYFFKIIKLYKVINIYSKLLLGNEMDYDPLFADGSDLETEDTPQEFSPLNSDIWRYGNTLIETPWSVPRTDESSTRIVNHPVPSTPTSSEMGRKRYLKIK